VARPRVSRPRALAGEHPIDAPSRVPVANSRHRTTKSRSIRRASGIDRVMRRSITLIGAAGQRGKSPVWVQKWRTEGVHSAISKLRGNVTDRHGVIESCRSILGKVSVGVRPYPPREFTKSFLVRKKFPTSACRRSMSLTRKTPKRPHASNSWLPAAAAAAAAPAAAAPAVAVVAQEHRQLRNIRGNPTRPVAGNTQCSYGASSMFGRSSGISSRCLELRAAVRSSENDLALGRWPK
jgi:hypothetical protein